MKKIILSAFVFFLLFCINLFADVLPQPRNAISHIFGISGGYVYDDKHTGEINLSYNYDHYFTDNFIKTMDFNIDAGYRFKDETYRLSYDIKVFLPLISIGGIHHYKDSEIVANGFTVSLNYTVIQAGYRKYDKGLDDEFFVLFRIPLFAKEHGRKSENIFTFF